MDQAKYAPCPACQAPIQPGHKFCGRCGETTPPEILNVNVEYFGELQDPGKANLVVVRGEGLEGLSYHLRASEHVIGRQGQIQLEDPFVSGRHANLFYQNKRLVLKDEGSLNGTFVRVRGKAKLAAGDTFLAGDQLFRIEPMPNPTEHVDAAGTYFYGSPTYATSFRVVQLLSGGAVGFAHCPRGTRVTIGRRGADINILGDKFLSEDHCSVEQDADGFTLTDNDSKNGTYVRLKRDQPLDHGDYFVLGTKLLRVEMNA